MLAIEFINISHAFIALSSLRSFSLTHSLHSASISLIRDFTLKFSIESSKSFTPNPKSVFVLQIHINIGGSQIRRTSSSSSAVQASFNFKLHSSSSSGSTFTELVFFNMISV
ncbi:hypothetical protein QL285_090953 [Trifolium repens]|nr:hypothetical protein QL285_090953 [Trifolium repens]